MTGRALAYHRLRAAEAACLIAEWKAWDLLQSRAESHRAAPRLCRHGRRTRSMMTSGSCRSRVFSARLQIR